MISYAFKKFVIETLNYADYSSFWWIF